MPLESASGVAGLASVIVLTATNWMRGGPPNEPVVVQMESLLAPWIWTPASSQPPPCDWINHSSSFTLSACSSFAISHTPTEVIEEARQRAVYCAAHWETTCVLSVEIGLALPAVFTYSQEQGMKALVAPRVLNRSGESVWTKVRNPSTGRYSGRVRSHTAIEFESLVDGVRRLETFSEIGDTAYCVQLLSHVLDEACAAELA